MAYDQKSKYDDLNELTGISKDEEGAMEREAYNGAADDIAQKEADATSGSTSDGRGSEKSEKKSLDDRLGDIKDGLGEGDDGGFFKNGKSGKAGQQSRVASAAGVFKNRKAVLGVGGGILGALVAGGMLFNFLHTFQLDHFFKNVDAKTSTRLSASLDVRNRHLVNAYMKIRVQEIEGGTENDNLYFKADKVDTNKPLSDWYRTMRKSNFEKDLLEKQGIQFVSMVGPDGKVNVAKLTGKDGIPPAVATKLAKVDNSNITDVINGLTGDEMEQAFTVDKFGSHSAARKSVREAVNKEIPWYQTFKRRHIRRDIANVTGIKEWRLFEKTRDKIAKNKQDVRDRLLNKIIDRYYVNNPASAQFMKCLFSDGRCPSNSDTSSPDAKTDDAKTGTTVETDKQAEEGAAEATQLGTAEVGDEITEVSEKVVEEGVQQTTEEAAGDALVKLGPGQKILIALVKTMGGDIAGSAIPFNPTKVWTWAKRIAKIDSMIKVTDGTSQISQLVKNSRRAQAMGIYATYSIANSQMKSGQLVGDELNAFFETTKNLGNTEGWGVTNGQLPADQKNNEKKKAYCEKDVSERTFEEFAWQCDDQKPNNGGTAQNISDYYDASVGKIAGPIAGVVNAAKDSPPGKFVDFVNEKIDSIVGFVVTPALEAVMKNTGLGTKVQELMGFAMTKLLGFLGAGPMFDGTQPGVGNILVTGAAATAEASTRASGGIRSTNQSLAYSNTLALNYTAEQNKDLSVYDRYASLNNTDSLASSTLFAISNNTSLSGGISKLMGSVASVPQMFGSIIGGHAFAQQSQSGSAIANWAGVDTYDIPKVCLELDPLDPNYQTKSTNAAEILGENGISGFTADMDTLRDTDKFWNAVYEKIGEKDNAQQIAEKIYNCALLDARVEGDLGYVYGYTDDGGYEGTTSNDSSSEQGVTNPNLFILGDSYTVGMKANGIEAKLSTAGWKPTIDAYCGRPLSGTGKFASCDSPSVQAFAGLGAIEQPSVRDGIKNSGAVLIGLGTNDLGGDPNSFRANVSTMIDEVQKINSGAKIYWTNLYLTTDKQASVAGYNQVLSDLSKEKGFTVIDWAADAPSNYNPNEIHPKDYAAITQLVLRVLGKPSSGGGGDFGWPEGPSGSISQCFTFTNGGGHPGLDILGGSGEGSPILAAADGEVTNAGPVNGYGPNFVAIKHSNGKGTSYGHMRSMSVKVGDKVTKGQQIGEQGNLGDSRGSHLHFNMFPGSYSGWDTPNIDPLSNGLSVPEGVGNPGNCS